MDKKRWISAASLLPDVILMDLNMPVLNGMETTKQLKLTHPDVKVIVLTSFSDQDHVLPAIRAGARGYLLKDIEPEELVNAIRRVHQGQVELHPEAAGQLMNMLTATNQESYTNTASKCSPLLPSQAQLGQKALCCGTLPAGNKRYSV